MSKRVSISYSVDLAEVPDRVSILLTELANSFGGLAKVTREIAAEVKEEPVPSIKKMQELISLLGKSTIRVEDCADILLGYLEVVNQLAAQLKESAEVDPPEKPKKKTSTKKKSSKKKKKKEKQDAD